VVRSSGSTMGREPDGRFTGGRSCRRSVEALQP
jgi:hypothetical protein